MESQHTKQLPFQGILYLNLETALRRVNSYISNCNPTDLSIIELYIMQQLYKNQEGLSAAELARLVGRAQTSFTPNLDSLEKKGYIRRKESKEDRRKIILVPTSHALKIKPDIDSFLSDVQLALFGQLERPTEFINALSHLQSME